MFGSFGFVKCEFVRIILIEGVKLYCLIIVCCIVFLLMLKVEVELNRLEKEGIIEKVEKLMDWCVFMVLVLKKNGNVRICVDFKKFNEVVKREYFMFLNFDDIFLRLVGLMLFFKFDVLSGFY